MRVSRAVSLAGVAVALVATVSCAIGTDPTRGRIARSPFGAEVTFRYGGQANYFDRQGELLAVQDEGVLVLHGTVIVLYARGARTSIQARHSGLGWIDLRDASEAELEDLAQFARYPFGLAGDQLEALLATLGRDAVVVRSD